MTKAPMIEQHGGTRPTVVLLHSSASSARQWESLAALLKPAFHVTAVDFHGHGAQPAWAGSRPMTLADDAALVLPLLQRAGGAHVVGHSYGGAIALKLATLAPHWVTSLTAYEPMLFSWIDGDGPGQAVREDFLACGCEVGRLLGLGDPSSAAQRFVDFWSGAGAWASLPPSRQQSIAGRMPAVHANFIALVAEVANREQVARLAMPMLLLSGFDTVPTTRRIAQLLRGALPQAGHEVLPAMGHMGPITHADAVNQRIAAFLRALAERSVAEEPVRAAA